MKFWYELDGALVRASASLAEDIRQGLRESVNPNDVARDVLTAFPTNDDKRRYTSVELREWANRHIKVDSAPLIGALKKLYATGWVLGQDAAGAAYSHAVLNKAAPTADDINNFFNIDWSSWTPGNRAAANLVNPPGGLQKLFDRNINRRIFIDGINRTTLDRIGTSLAYALNKGISDVAIRDNIYQTIKDATNGVIDDPRRALTIATTEMARATSVASLESYQEFGLEQVEWLALDPCDICAGNEDAGAINVGDEFPSGDTEPPAHPNCRCSLIPVVDGATAAAADTASVDGLPAGYAAGDELAVADAAAGLMESGVDALAVDTHPDLEVATTEIAPPRAPFNPKTIVKPAPAKTFEHFTQSQIESYMPRTPDGQISFSQILSAPNDTTLTKQLTDLGFNNTPTLVDGNELQQLTAAGWQPIYRGIAGDTAEQVTQYANDYRHAAEPFIGKGMFGNGAYFATEQDVAENFAKVDRVGNEQSTGQVLNAALHPDARIIDFEDASRLLNAADVRKVWNWGENDDFLSNIVAAKGYDAIRVVNPIVNWKGERVNATYWVILNRGALAVQR